MDHGPNEVQQEDPATVVRNQRFGLKLFAIYATTYFLFIFCCIGTPRLLESSPLFGVINSVVFGFGLIFLAIAIALIYEVACRESRVVKSGAVVPDPSRTGQESGQ